jgi:hypothetical protein
VGFHQFGYISEGNVLGNADSRNFDIGNTGFHALDECRWLHTERLKRKTGLSIQLPATGGNIPAGFGMIFECRVRDYARDAVCIRLPVTDNQNLIQDYSPPLSIPALVLQGSDYLISWQTAKEPPLSVHFHAPKYISINEGADVYHTIA